MDLSFLSDILPLFSFWCGDHHRDLYHHRDLWNDSKGDFCPNEIIKSDAFALVC